MSGEFGEYGNCGYFDTKIRSAYEDCSEERGEARGKLTKLWGLLLKEMIDVAHSIGWYEACDSGYYQVVRDTIIAIPAIQKQLDVIKQEVEIYERLIEDAIREKVH